MTEKQRITITGKNINDIFNLPCVYRIDKDPDGILAWCRPTMMIDRHPERESGMYMLAQVGDTLVEYDNGKWEVIRKQNGI